MIAHSKSEAKRLSVLTGEWVEYIEQQAVDVRAAMAAFATDLRKAHDAIAELIEAAKSAEAALSDIGDADREPGDDVVWCERRAYEAIPRLRAAETRLEMQRDLDEAKLIAIDDRAYELYDQWVDTPAVIADEISAVLATNKELAKELIFGDGICALKALRDKTKKSMRENAFDHAEDQIESEIEEAKVESYLDGVDGPFTYGRAA